MIAPRNVGGLVTAKTALTPRSQAAAASFSLEGTAIAKKDAHSALIKVAVGADEGTPTSFAVDAKLQHRVAGGSWADVSASALTPSVAIDQITDENTNEFLEVNLSELLDEFRLVFTVAFVDGTTPKIGIGAECVLGGLIDTPPSHT